MSKPIRRAWFLVAITIGCSGLLAVRHASTVWNVLEPDEEREREHGGRPMPYPDSPAQALEFRKLQWNDESGTYPENGLMAAKAHVDAMREFSRSAAAQGAGLTTANWTWLGPGNIGGRVRSMVIHPTNPNIMFAGSVGGGIFKTSDGGASWSPVNDFMANLAVSTMVIQPGTPTTMYAGTGEGFYNGDGLRGAGVFKSIDGGTTWTQLASTANSSWYYVNRLAVSPDGAVLLAATRSGIYRSIDGGAIWQSVRVGEMTDIEFNPVAISSKAIASGYSGDAYWSNDLGLTWFPASGIPSGPFSRVETAYARSNPEIVYASVDKNNGSIYRSVDGGVNYALVFNGGSPSLLRSQGWYDNALWVNPTDPSVIVVGGVDLWRINTKVPVSFSQISNWQYAPLSAHADHHVIVESPGFNGTTNSVVFFGNDGGVYKNNDVNTAGGGGGAFSLGWTSLNNNLGVTQFYGAGGDPVTGVILGGTQDNGTLRYVPSGGTSWTTEFGGDGGYSAVDPANSNNLYGEYVYLALHRSTNGGDSADWINGLFRNGSQYGCKAAPYVITDSCNASLANFIAPFILDPNNSNRLLAGGRSLWVTNDATAPLTPTTGPRWTNIKPSTTFDNISAIGVARFDSNQIWIGHNSGKVFKTVNGLSATPAWTQVGAGTLPARFVTRVRVDPTNSMTVYASFGGYLPDNLWKSVDGGVNWTPIAGAGSTSLPAVPVRDVAINSQQPAWLYAATEIGVFTSEDGGISWFVPQNGPSNVSVDELFWLGPSLVAVTHGRGLFKAVITPPTGTSVMLGFTSSTASVPESIGSATSLVVLTTSDGNPTTQPVSVTYGTASGTATAGIDYVAATGTVSWPAGTPSGTTRPISVSIVNDALSEANETFTLTVSNPVGAILGGNFQTITIIDDDPQPAMSVNDVSITEGNSGIKTATFTATLSSVSGQTVSANYATADGTAASTGTPAGTFANTSAITIQDVAAAAPYPSTINVSGVTGPVSKVKATLTNFSHTFPSDVAVLLVGPAGQNVMLMSGAGGIASVSNITMTFDDAGTTLPTNLITSGTYRPSSYVSRTFAPPAPTSPYGTALSVFSGVNPNGAWKLYVIDSLLGDVGTISGGWSLSFESGNDYVATSGQIVFPPNTTSRSFTVNVVGDTIVEPDETFFVNLSNPLGATLARTQVLGTILNDDFVGMPPAITTQPQSQTVGLGLTATMNVVATGTAPLSYQWYRGSTLDTTNPIPGATSSSYTTPVLALNRVVLDTFTGANGTPLTSHTADVHPAGAAWTLNGSPTPTLQAGGVGVAPGAGHMQVTVDSGLADMVAAVQYKVGDGPGMGGLAFRLLDTDNHFVLLTFENTLWLYRKQSGSYTALASQPLPAALVSGSTHRLEVRTLGSAIEGWFDDARLLSASDSFQQTATSHGLDWNTGYDATTTYDNFSVNSGALTSNYWARVSNAYPPAVNSAPATITIGLPPTITTQPQSQTIASGQTATMSVVATGTGTLSYQWYQGASPDTTSPIPGATANTYTTPALTSTISYWVRVSSAYLPAADSAAATVTMGAPPAITTQPQSQTIGLGQTATMNVIASGTPPLSYQWYRGSSPDTANPIPGATANSYTTPPVASTTNYWVRVSNSYLPAADSASATITLALPGTPGTPSPANGAIDVATNAALTWSATSAASYDLQFGITNPPPPVASALTSASYTSALAPSTTYFWRVVARNAGGTTTGPVWSFTTATPPPPPPDLLVRDTFAGINGTLLTAHTPDVNLPAAPWTVTGATPIPTLTGGAVGVVMGSGHLQATLDMGLSDVFMSVDYHVGSGPQLGGIVFRLTDANNHMLLLAMGNTLQFFRKQAGAYIPLASGTISGIAPVAIGSTHRLELRLGGGALTGMWDNVPVVTTADTFQQTATRHGLDWNSSYDPTATFDNFEIRTTTGLPIPLPGTPNALRPADSATAVALNATLTWSATNATSYDLQFGTSNPPPPVPSALTSASYTPALAPTTTYFWRVVAHNAGGTTTGPVWSFTTAAPPPLPPDLLVRDTFAGIDGTLLTAHTPDVNLPAAPWTVTGATPIPTLTGGVLGVVSGGGHLQATLDMGLSDVFMSVDYHVGSGPQLAGIVFRLTDANNHMLLLAIGNSLQFFRKQAGAYIPLDSGMISGTAPVTMGSTHRLEVRVSGGTLQGLWDNVLVVTTPDTFQQTATRHGLDWNSSYDPTATFDNFEIRTTTGLPIPLPGTPSTPAPADSATAVALNATLTWTAANATSYDLQFGATNPPPPVPSPLTSASYTPALAPTTTYFWRVVARNSRGTTTGPVWSFTTGTAPAIPADVLVQDTFTGANGMLLTTHAPDFTRSPATWTVTGATPVPTLTGGVVGVVPGSGHLQATIETGIPDIIMAADYKVGMGTQLLGALVFRFTDAYNHLLLVAYGDTLQFFKKQGGDYMPLASGMVSALAGSTHRLEVRAIGSVLEAWWDNTRIIQTTDSSWLTATRHGLDWNSSYDATATFDNLEIRNATVPVAPPEVFAGSLPLPESGRPDAVGAYPPPVRRLTFSDR